MHPFSTCSRSGHGYFGHTAATRRHAGGQFNGARFLVETDAADETAFDAGFVGNRTNDVTNFNAMFTAHINPVANHVASGRATTFLTFAAGRTITKAIVTLWSVPISLLIEEIVRSGFVIA